MHEPRTVVSYYGVSALSVVLFVVRWEYYVGTLTFSVCVICSHDQSTSS